MAATATSFGPDLSVSFETQDLPEASPAQEFFRFRFGKNLRDDGTDNIFRLHIEPVGYGTHDEIWHTRGPVETSRSDGFILAECGQHLAVHIEIDSNPHDNIGNITADVYCRLLDLVRRRGYPNLVRTWNFFPGINEGNGDQERYKLFTAGRAMAYEEFGYVKQRLPAGTAIGTDPDTPFTISALATRKDCSMVENPRQISAYKYPRNYGPKSPSFSRAVTIASADGRKILISGTSSIVGHESRHDKNPVQQILETMQNLEDLVQHAKDLTESSISNHRLFDCYMRVYLRSKEQALDIRRALRERLSSDHRMVFLRGDICRRELLVEIEAACTI